MPISSAELRDSMRIDLTESAARIVNLERALTALLRDVVPHVKDTGHNAADRDIRESIKLANATIGNQACVPVISRNKP